MCVRSTSEGGLVKLSWVEKHYEMKKSGSWSHSEAKERTSRGKKTGNDEENCRTRSKALREPGLLALHPSHTRLEAVASHIARRRITMRGRLDRPSTGENAGHPRHVCDLQKETRLFCLTLDESFSIWQGLAGKVPHETTAVTCAQLRCSRSSITPANRSIRDETNPSPNKEKSPRRRKLARAEGSEANNSL